MNPHLFVYGTLMPEVMADYGRPMRDRLLGEAVHLGPASVAGLLFDMGRYPGLVEGGDTLTRVRGELLRLNDPSATFAWLDRYENIAPDVSAGANEYARVERMALIEGTIAPLRAWVYVYQWSVAQARLVESGRWR